MIAIQKYHYVRLIHRVKSSDPFHAGQTGGSVSFLWCRYYNRSVPAGYLCRRIRAAIVAYKNMAD